MNSKKFECALGFHEYTIPDKKYPHIKMCKHCKRFGYYKDSAENEIWYAYNNNGNKIHFRNNHRHEEWLHKGKWTTEKPKDWKYE